jgi:hypothetical protein
VSSCSYASVLHCRRFATPYIHDILATYQLQLGNSVKTVSYLQRTFPRLATETEARFAHLSESTVRSWHDASHKLLPRFRAILDAGQTAAPRGPGVAERYADTSRSRTKFHASSPRCERRQERWSTCASCDG